MLRFEWSAFVTPGLLQQLAEAAQAPLPAVQALSGRLARLFQHVGGLPFVAAEPSLDARSAQGLCWLDEALGHTLAEQGVAVRQPGLLASAGTGPCEQWWATHPRLDARRADAEAWAQLPGLNATLAQAIVDEREWHGRFRDLADWEQRVKGIGPVRAAALAELLDFDADPLGDVLPADAAAGQAAWATRLRALMRRQAADSPAQALVAALNQVLASVGAQPHPASAQGQLRGTGPADDPLPWLEAEWVGEMWSRRYWRGLPALLDAASHSVELCMFHAAAVGPEHPTRALLQALVRAAQRGVAVRALLDRDGKTDPYHSTLINSAARRLLTEGGVACRSDSSARLLHSKYLVIDGRLVVLGSHNWSAGSYFRFDDLSLALQSPALAARLLARFDAQWARAS